MNASMTVIPGVAAFRISFDGFYDQILMIGVGIAIFAAVVLVAGAGYKLMLSEGGENVKKAKDEIQDALLGAALVVGAVTIARLIFNALGIKGFF
jgi:hypothetical protein